MAGGVARGDCSEFRKRNAPRKCLRPLPDAQILHPHAALRQSPKPERAQPLLMPDPVTCFAEGLVIWWFLLQTAWRLLDIVAVFRVLRRQRPHSWRLIAQKWAEVHVTAAALLLIRANGGRAESVGNLLRRLWRLPDADARITNRRNNEPDAAYGKMIVQRARWLQGQLQDTKDSRLRDLIWDRKYTTGTWLWKNNSTSQDAARSLKGWWHRQEIMRGGSGTDETDYFFCAFCIVVLPYASILPMLPQLCTENIHLADLEDLGVCLAGPPPLRAASTLSFLRPGPSYIWVAF
ncbi:hypothetical protein DL769_000156 [Monosporascus sp. CRB-8-3]|nr:hypothetical protein DL769_000156 [Monosporascus sp. CRB-8-3]